MDRVAELRQKAATGQMTAQDAAELTQLSKTTPDTHLTSQTNASAAIPGPAPEGDHRTSLTNYVNNAPGIGTHETSLTNYLNADKTPQGPAPTKIVAPTAPVANPAPVAPIAKPAEPAGEGKPKTSFGDKLKKVGIGIADMIEATAKGYAGSSSPTRLSKEYQAKLNQDERTLVDKLDAQRQANAEAAQLKILASQQGFQSKENALDRAIAQANAKGQAPAGSASIIPQ